MHALEIAKEAFEELSDVTAVTFIEDTLVFQENGNDLTNSTALTSFISSIAISTSSSRVLVAKL